MHDKNFKIYTYDSLESTNKTAKELAAAGAGHGTIVMAETQTAGKGRYGRSFFSPPGHGIYMSLIFCPGNPELLTLHAAVSVCKTVEALAKKEPKIKWVNDVYLNGKKICGILAQSATDSKSGNMRWAVVGIGVNFDTAETDFPDELKNIAGSVFSGDNPGITRDQFAYGIIGHMMDFESYSCKEKILGEYKKRLMILGKRVVISGFEETYEAIAVDIDDMGRLIVKKGDGEISALSSGEIKSVL